MRLNALAALVDDLRVHRAAVLGVRMSEHDRGSHAAGLSGVDQSVGVDGPDRLWLVEQRFEASGRSGDLTQRHQATSGARTSGPAAGRTRRSKPGGELANDRCELGRTRDRPEMAGPLENDAARAANQRHVPDRAVDRDDVIERRVRR